MELLVGKILVGFVVGVLIGLSGVGGGVLLLPVLIFGLKVPAIVAVGSDALFNFFTKIPASLLHLKKGTVKGKVVAALAVGSIPGSYCGVKMLMHIRHLYGDGVIKMIFTPGHAPGHQSFLLTLPESGTILLTVDATYTMDHWNEKCLPGFLTSAIETAHSVRKLRMLAEQTNALVVTGHDPDMWPSFKKAPDYYA